MSSSAKTEKPTPKKKHDAGKKGQIWRSQDLITLIVLFGGACLLRYAFPLIDIMRDMLGNAESGFQVPLVDYLNLYLATFARFSAMIIGLAVLLSALPSLLMSRFRFASEVVKLDFSAVNPINGIKKIFNLRTVKDAIKACLYLLAYLLAAKIFWHTHRLEILGLARRTPTACALSLGELAFSLAAVLLGATLLLAVADMFIEYLLYIRDLKMSRDEVKREYKEQYGAPEVKQERRRLGQELLSGEVLGNVEESNFILANPTHIAIGIYINPAISIMPFISVMEVDERAQAVIAHAREKGIPVVRNIPLARRIFKQNRRYSFVSEDCLDDVAQVLLWLIEVEKAHRDQYETEAPPDPAADMSLELPGDAAADASTAAPGGNVASDGGPIR
ncbi:SctU family type III secretion system export apparatus subunit BsaZ [Achromobacter xylosoxidans]